MAAPFSIKNSLGVDLNEVVTAVEIASGKNKSKHRLGTTVDASNGRTFVYAQANATIAAATAVCSVSPTTFLATATAGTYLSHPTLGVVAGDYLWLSKAGV